MKLIYTILIVYLVFVPNNASNLLETQRQLHRCYVNCFFIISFNDTVSMPTDCTIDETDLGCEVTAILNYQERSISIYSYRIAGSLIVDNSSFESITSHVAHFEFGDGVVNHLIDYICALGDFCEWEYITQIIPKLITLNYEPLYNSLLPKVFNVHGHSNLTECYNNTELVHCPLGTCQFYENINDDDDYKLTKTRFCSVFGERFVEAGQVRYSPSSPKYDHDIISFTCDLNKCNDEITEKEIKQIIITQGNEYINYTTTETSTTATSTETSTTATSTETSTVSTSSGTSRATTYDNTTSNSIKIQFQWIYLIWCFWKCFF